MIRVRVRVITDHNFNFTVYKNKILSFFKSPLQFLKLGTLLRTPILCGWFLFNVKGRFIENIIILRIFLDFGHKELPLISGSFVNVGPEDQIITLTLD